MAELDGRVAGVAGCKPDPEHEGWLNLGSLYVDGACQGRGVGRTLIQTVCFGLSSRAGQPVGQQYAAHPPLPGQEQAGAGKSGVAAALGIAGAELKAQSPAPSGILTMSFCRRNTSPLSPRRRGRRSGGVLRFRRWPGPPPAAPPDGSRRRKCPAPGTSPARWCFRSRTLRDCPPGIPCTRGQVLSGSGWSRPSGSRGRAAPWRSKTAKEAWAKHPWS